MSDGYTLEITRRKVEVFSFYGADGSVHHWNVTDINAAIADGSLQSFERVELAITDECYRAAAERGGVEEDHLPVAVSRIAIPIIVVMDHDNTAIIVDGNHRIVARKRHGLDTVPAFLFPIDTLSDFEIDPADMPNRKENSNAKANG